MGEILLIGWTAVIFALGWFFGRLSRPKLFATWPGTEHSDTGGPGGFAAGSLRDQAWSAGYDLGWDDATRHAHGRRSSDSSAVVRIDPPKRAK